MVIVGYLFIGLMTMQKGNDLNCTGMDNINNINRLEFGMGIAL